MDSSFTAHVQVCRHEPGKLDSVVAKKLVTAWPEWVSFCSIMYLYWSVHVIVVACVHEYIAFVARGGIYTKMFSE